MNLILNSKSKDLINQWMSVLLRIREIERADLECFHSHVMDVVSLMSQENIDDINRLSKANNLQKVGVKPVTDSLWIADEDLPS